MWADRRDGTSAGKREKTQHATLALLDSNDLRENLPETAVAPYVTFFVQNGLGNSVMLRTPTDELSSWKEIAAYLGVGVRTAQVWERDRNMPVRRLPGGRGRVLASILELEKWKRSADSAISTDSTPVTETRSVHEPAFISDSPAPRTPERSRLRSTFVVLTIVIITAFAAIAAHTWNRTPVSARVDRDVLIAVDDTGRETWRKAFPLRVAGKHPPGNCCKIYVGRRSGR